MSTILVTCIDAATSIGAGSVPKRLVRKLIHRNSVKSPMYNSVHTDFDRAKFAFEDSISRVAMIEEKMESCKGNMSCSDKIQANLHAKAWVGVFFVEFYIKDLSHRMLAVMDTGSPLLWVHCIPCPNCAQASTRIYDPSTSSTYTNISCRSKYCQALRQNSCDQRGNCKYELHYEGAHPTEGMLATESFIFDTSDDGLLTVPHLVFGCSHVSDEKPDAVMGVLGLSSNKVSLATRLGNKFSYCVGGIKDPSYEYNQLILGEGAILEGDSTPLEIYNGFYYVTMEGISLGGAMLDIEQNTFQRTDSGQGGVMIDSGGELSFLVQRAYEELADAVMNMLDLNSWFKSELYFSKLCFEGNVTRDIKGFPSVTFHFSGGAEMGLEAESLFSQSTTTTFCMTILQADYGQPSLIGVGAQQYHNVGYDISGKKLYLRRMDCELLDE
ncbi:aspartic proteinase CDR1 [Eucalyptus grandis]|uniref:aspartic proteinase CDR1 n=1 Tax=Eucalyptus grandis TaxID=71139 RepID=UPI00192EE96B|nr:aspartic proteinase CDR1 [Eucalyptus grandis]